MNELEPSKPRSGPAPRRAVAAEFARALGSAALLPLQWIDFAMCRDALRSELADLLDHPAAPAPVPDLPPPPARPLRIFVSCAEASGEIHAANLITALRADLAAARAPAPELVGLGGRQLAALGVRTLEDPVQRATMGFDGVFAALPYYLRLLERCAAHFASEPPDVAVLIDSPALHVPLGRIARRYGVRVVHFVAPQHWGWAPWRTRSYARAVDRALTILPFEPAWFARRGVDAVHVGHPLLDQLANVPATRPSETARVLAILPGSRERVIDLNLPWMLRVAARVRSRLPELEVAVVHGDEARRFQITEHVAGADASDWCRIEIGDLHGSLARARAALSVSGTVLLDVLHHRLPSVCVYRVGSARDVAMYHTLLSTPYFASLNLLAGREVVPEFCFRGDGPIDRVVEAVELACGDADARRDALEGLDLAAERLGPSGACARAARHVLQLALQPGALSLAVP